MSQPHWHVLGVGAIGTLFVTALAEAGLDSELISRQVGERQRELQLVSDQGTRARQFTCSPASGTAPIERLLVTTKAYALKPALHSVAHRLTRDCEVVLLINGMGLAEIARQICPDAGIYCGTTTEGAYVMEKNKVRHSGRGVTLLGSLEGAARPAWFSRWQAIELESHWADDIESALWHKLAINCAINPLTALHRCNNGHLLQDRQLAAEFDSLCDEIALISESLGFAHTASKIHTAARTVASATADNRSSMLQDVSMGRKTEIDFITGYLVRCAQEQGVDVPRNRALLEALDHA